MILLSEIYDVTLKRGIRGKASEGFVRPTIGENFMTHRDFQEIDSNIGNDEYTKLLLHMDGEDGAKVFTDVSSSSHTVTPTASKVFTFTRPNGQDIGEGWTKSMTTGGDVSILNNKLYTSVISDVSNSMYSQGASYFNISGDFDIQVEFNSINFPDVTTGVNLLSLSVWAESTAGGSNYVANRLIKDSNRYQYQYIRSYDGVLDYEGTNDTNDTSGKLRITRSGSTFTTYYWSGTSWVKIGQASLWSTDAQVRVISRCYYSDSDISVTYDNFQINSGTLINYPSPITKTDVKKFGTASSYFGGDVSYLEIPASDDFNFGSGDFTIDGWFNFNSLNVGTFPVLLSHWNGGSSNKKAWQLYYVVDSALMRFTYSINGATNIDKEFSWSPSLEVWYHISVVRSGSHLHFFVNGEQINPIANISTDFIYSSTWGLYVGATFSNDIFIPTMTFKGYNDELRISKGIARWTENFTPPTRSYN